MPATFNGRVAVVGLGYIGLPTAACLAVRSIDVVGVDINAATVKSVNHGEVPFVEPDLSAAVSGAVAMGRLTASTEMPEADAYIIAVPTPFAEAHQADLAYVRSAVEAIAPKLKGGEVVVLESTSPPGTTRAISEQIAQMRPDLVLPHASEGVPDVFVAHCPERVLPGRIMIEMITNDRVVGGITPRCAEKAAEIYRVFTQGKIVISDAASAEMAKLVENAYRDVNIAFANELSLIGEDLELDVWEVIRLANHHPRVNVLTPGPGVGGHCIAVDPWFIVGADPGRSRLIRQAREINDHKPVHVADQVARKTERFKSPTVACLGLAYKANVDDLRESPAIDIVEHLALKCPDLDVRVAEPHVSSLPMPLEGLDNVRLEAAADAIAAADIVVMLVAHDHFKSLSRSRLAGKVVYDTVGLWR
ncbi:UDP-N-acetyl-D-mannosamine dehydrogenase [Nocardioides albus]|uniref:UDP-N-acetyl-D-mannosaminuronic acid dehydrogenase n=1 Tax=Nocardioides albus TaxID=1841 RepID=A0A7W5A0R1_9ACTN|nr:UDP-N-acetyl-D-mannosamine dehydrogenase [Nocardioides albus]MBB3087149.1 UDP-N-acetyl-D-mannosaminuronic acid dehydrogenase [Nocardioides albus]GGU06980.1 UDP-N-acetyl-D-mannosamine dehydrogenase [Nocardioides albus]